MLNIPFQKKQILQSAGLLAIFIFYLFTRLFLVLQQGPAAFGYDTGIYRHVIAGYYERLHDTTLVPFGFTAYSNFLKFLGESTDNILVSWYIFISVFLFFVFYLFVKTYTNTATALLAVFLFSLSIVQYELYWWFYYRNFLAFGLFFVTLILLHYRSYLAILPLIALGTVHVLTLLPIGVTMMLLVFFEKETRKYYFLTGAAALSGVLLLNYKELLSYVPQIQQTHGQVSNLDPGQSEFSGQFLDLSFFVKHTLLYGVFGLLGFFQYFKKYKTVSLLFLVSLLPLIFQILFYRRFYIFIDVCLIFFAAVFISQLLKSQKHFVVQIAFFFFAAVGIFLSTGYIIHKQPLLTHTDLQNIMSLDTIAPAYVMSLSSASAPWLYGFTHHAIIAPGIFEENKWNRGQWEIFWTTVNQTERHELLNQYPTPLYIFVGPAEQGFRGILASDEHFVEKSPFLWEYKP